MNQPLIRAPLCYGRRVLADSLHRGSRGLILGIVLLALLLRLVLLEARPLHADEGVNGWLAEQIGRQGYFRYDPVSFHGPLHFYALFLADVLLGSTVWALRLPTALVSAASIALLWTFRRFIGNRIAVWAAAAMAVSPGAVYFGRDAIHEPWLAFFLILFAWGLAGLHRFGRDTYLIASGAGLAGMILTKETYLLHLVAVGLTFGTVWLWNRLSPPAESFRDPPNWKWRDLFWVAIGSAAIVIFFYSGNLGEPSMLKGLYQTFSAQFGTGVEGEGHEKPWWYWGQLLTRYEWPALIGFLSAPLYLWPRRSLLLRSLAVYGSGALVAYSIIPYKTPWCVISLLWPFFLLFGAAVQEGANRWRPSLVYGGAILVLLASLASSIRLNFFNYTDAREPYVYVQTTPEIERLLQPLQQLCEVDPSAYEASGVIALDYSFPLPWLLRSFPEITYVETGFPEDVTVDFLAVADSRAKAVEARLQEPYFMETMVLRPGEEPARLFFRAGRFKAIFQKRTPEFQPAVERQPATP